MTTVEELIVKAEPEGLNETSEGFEQMQEDMEEAEGQMQDTTDQFTELQGKWQGAMTAIVAGLATATAGILSQVPLLGELASAIGSVISAVGLQLDQLLRDLGAGGLVQAIFEFSRAIFRAEGVIGDFVGALGALGGVLAGLGLASQLGLIGSVSGALTTAWGALAGAATTVVGALAAVLGISTAVAAGLAIAVAAVIGFAAAYITNFKGVRDKTNKIISDIINAVSELASAIISRFKKKINKRIGQVTRAAELIGEHVRTTVNSLVSDAKQWGKDLINEFVNGIKNNNKIKKLRDAVGNLANEVDKHLPGSPADVGPLSDLDEAGPGLVETFSTGISANVGMAGRASDDLASAADPDGFAAGRTIETRLFVDGREVNRGTERFRDDETSRRGAF